ncbi:MAG: AMP-binding protein [Actinomycetota bacterium]
METLVVGDLLRARTREFGDKLFLWCGDARYTFAEMDATSDRIAAGLAERGIAKGDRVAFVSTNRPEMLEMMFACAKLGAIQVPLNAFLRGDFLRYQLADSQASTLVVDREGFDASIPLLDRLPELKRVVAFDPVAAPAGVEVVGYGDVAASQAPVPAVDVSAGDLMSILYTSGTTGLPKGCMMANGYYVNVGSLMKEVWGIRSSDVAFTALPLFHGAARTMIVMAALVHGATAVVEPAFSLGGVLDRMIETGATIFGGVGAMGVALLSTPPSEKDREHSLRLATFIPFSAALQERFTERFGVPCQSELFGQTECAPTTYSTPDGPRNPASAGRPAAHLEVKLVDDEDHEVAVGDVGEIVSRPRIPYAMYSGYWNKPEETVKAWRNLWHHTGDYGRADEGGFIHFVDRKKDSLRRRGENISSMELEMAIVQHDKILEAAVHAVPSDLLEDDVKACIVLAPGQAIEPAELFEFFKTGLPYYAVPRYVEIVPELPKNAVARVMKHLLRERGVTGDTWDFEALGLTIAKDERRSV